MQDKQLRPTLNSHSPLLTHRYTQLQDWLQQINQTSTNTLTKLAGDASFRCYYRLINDKGSFVVMDAPPDKESCRSFVAVAELLQDAGVMVPTIHHQDLERGFLLLSDLGDNLYYSMLTLNNCNQLYQRAFETLATLSRISLSDNKSLSLYDEKKLLSEMQLFADWYLVKYKKVAVNIDARKKLRQVFKFLVENALAQPKVCVHRDFHSRNLLLCEGDQVGVLDFQDAVYGPVTYDLVSLLRDCYLEWPQEKVDNWVSAYYSSLQDANVLKNVSLEHFIRWFDLMGLQRHLKCLGIFVRLHVRDQKSSYLDDIPRVLAYVKRVCEKYQELQPLLSFLERE